MEGRIKTKTEENAKQGMKKEEGRKEGEMEGRKDESGLPYKGRREQGRNEC